MSVADAEIDQAIRTMATGLLSDVRSIGAQTAAAIASAMPQLADGPLRELLERACASNTRSLLEAIEAARPVARVEPSIEVMAITRALVQQGVSHDELIRAYQVGLVFWCERWGIAAEQTYASEPRLTVRVTSHGISYLVGWLERMTTLLSAEYRDEAERLAREGSLARLAEVRRILDADDVDTATLSTRLGYDLGGPHTAVVVQRLHNGVDVALESSARAICASVGPQRPLVIRASVDAAWCWIPTTTPRTSIPAATGVAAGIGRSSRGLAGFRRSLKEANEAARVAMLAPPDTHVAAFQDCELDALCTVDPDAAREFVASTLGPLHQDEPQITRLRKTLEAYFAANSNFRAAAARLGVHHNTVRYRLEQVETLLGQPAQARRLELELALRLASVLNPQSKARR
jgi:hypothetical protein